MQNSFKFLDAYAPIFYSDKTYFIISGGRASGKSTQVAAFFLVKLFGNDYFRGVVSRYTLRSISSSIYRDILDLIDKWGVANRVVITGEEIRNPANGNMIITHALKISESSASAKSKGLSNVTHLLIDEATEMTEESEYIKLIDSFRTKGAERKIFLCFNPTSKAHFLFKRFYLPDGRPHPQWEIDHCFLHTTYHDNAEHIDPSKIAEWERMKTYDPAYYNHQILGHWADVGEGQVFTQWNWSYFEPDPEAEVVYGLDFGYAKDPSACVKIWKRGRKLWLQEVLYETGLTNEDLSAALVKKGIEKGAALVADSAEPKSIETLRRLGWRNIRPSLKGNDSIRNGIDTVHSYEVFADPMSFNLRLEYDNYVYRSGTDKPVDDWCHLMDALRYGVGTSLRIGSASNYALAGARGRDKLLEW
jgi:phage terminase large subunit